MKQFKFRGFYEDKTVYFTLQNIMGNSQGVPCVFFEKEDDGIRSGFYVSINLLENVSPFIGLKDKNGKEIYEGDLIIDDSNPDIIKQIIYIDYQTKFVAQHKTYQDWRDMIYSETCKVIGNIYQNPNY